MAYMTRLAGKLLLLLPILLALIACQPDKNLEAQHTVSPKDYNSFWLWGPLPASSFKQTPQQLYILQGEIGWSSMQQQSTLQPQGLGLQRLPARQGIWLVYRTTHLNWSPQNIQAIIRRLNSWQKSDNHVIGLQVDFDAATRNLDSYAVFLQRLRQQLPPQYQLSVTGLLDWVNHNKPQTFARLAGSVDEVVLQTYQGRSTIPHYQHYMQQLSQLSIPFKIGLVAGGGWQANSRIEQHPGFKGYVVFIPVSSRG